MVPGGYKTLGRNRAARARFFSLVKILDNLIGFNSPDGIADGGLDMATILTSAP